jgi:hypothetical protein
MRRFSLSSVSLALLAASICCASLHGADNSSTPIAARYKEGTLHGFLVLSTLEGNPIAAGDSVQSAHGEQITNRLTFHFKDGSLQQETTVFTQRGYFRLVSYHLVQKGAAFPHPMDLSVVTATGEATVHTTDDKGQEKVFTEHLKLPPDLGNGLVLTLLKNMAPTVSAVKIPMVVATPKPRLIQLSLTAQGEESFSIGGSSRKAKHYLAKIELGGVAGVVAPMLGKEPPDNHIWILGGDVPTFVKSETLSYTNGPLWRTELLAPSWPKAAASDEKAESPGKKSE